MCHTGFQSIHTAAARIRRELQEEPSSKLEESMKFGAETIKTEVDCLSVAQYKAYKQSVESERRSS